MYSGLEIRPRVDEDAEDCVRLLVEVHAHDGYPVEGIADPHGWLAIGDLGEAWVATGEGVIAGHIGLSFAVEDDAVKLWKARSDGDKRTVASISRLFVAPAARSQGVGCALLAQAVRVGQARDWQLVLDVMEKDRAAIHLYERMGWVCIGRVTHEFGEGKQVPALAYALPR